ncbi:MAG: hypothetical protein CL930_06630 [Deltaproteobacteria bacterium]|nr:hypothetical protein [Deltaproteobacteria bacterium]|tara:strand:- start:10 stop:606 length:597 start_codon:yes stop_codon:yes gene_type:complete
MLTRFMMPTVLAAIACSTKGTDTGDGNEGQRCDATVTFSFPDGSQTEYDGCHEVLVDATYEFDPDDPPEIRSFKLQLTEAESPGFECWLVMTSTGICGPGFYGVGSAQSTSIEFATYDCSFVPDEYEGQYEANDGTVLLESVYGGDSAGDFTNVRLLTEFVGSVEASTSNGIGVVVQFDVAAYIRGDDSEETDCLPAD